jgi:hypothetical protein
MRPLRRRIRDLRMGCELPESFLTRPIFGGTDQRRRCTLTAHVSVNVPTLQVRDGAGSA